MAATVTTQKMHDGIGCVMQKITILGDAAGDIAAGGNVMLADPTGFTPVCGRVRIDRVRACLGGFSATIYWDATTDVFALAIPADTNVDMDFRDIGGLSPTGAAGQTGKIQIVTSGLTTGEGGYIILDMTKKA